MSTEVLSAARELGWSIIPVGLDKRPLISSWKPYQTRKPNADELKTWVGKNPAGWAVITGNVSKLAIIDFDGDIGIETMNKMGLSPHVKTGSGGFHLYVNYPADREIKTLNSKSKKELGELYPGLDVRGMGGYAIFYGKNAHGDYEWLRPMEPDEPSVLPIDLRRYLGFEKPLPNGTIAPEKWHKAENMESDLADRLLSKYLDESKNGRNDAGFALACQLRDNNYTESAASLVMRDYASRVSAFNTKGQNEPYTEKEALTSLRKAFERSPRQPWQRDVERVLIPKHKRPEPQEFLDIIPEASFLDLYSQYCLSITDAPAEFHLANGLSVISSIIGNRIWFDAWGEHVYPNMWQVILAPSGFFRKTTSMKLGMKLVKRARPQAILANDFTREKLVDTLSEKQFGVIPVWEFGALLQNIGREYNSGLKEFLTEIYDTGDYTRDTRSSGSVKIEGCALSIIAGSTIDWIIDRINGGDLRSGFLARFLFWPATRKNGWRGFGDTANVTINASMLSFVDCLAEMKGEATFDAEVIVLYNAWLREHENEVNTHALPVELQGFYTRIGTYVLKLAVLYQLSLSLSLEVTMEAMSYAIKLAEYLKSHLIRLIEDELVFTRDGKEIKRIKEIIQSAGTIERAELVRKAKMQSRRLDGLLMTLQQGEELVTEKIRKEGSHKSSLFYTIKTS